MNFIFLENDLYGIEKTIGHNLFTKGGIDGISWSEHKNVETIRFTSGSRNILRTVTIELTNRMYKIMNLKVLEIKEVCI
jgi:hypothetical protein